jgi:PBSX family phage terminase large subunit
LTSPFDTAKEVSSFKINGNTLHFVGADTPAKFEGAGSDVAYYNEMLDISQVVFDQIEQRCREMIIGDYNPKFSQHWVYDSILKRPDCAYLHSTFLDNPFCSDSEKRKILSYEPTEQNIANGTANDYRWKVYGLGERSSQEGLIFRFANWVDAITDDCENYFWGLDFGNTTGTYALAKGAFNSDGLWLDCPIYGSFASTEDCAADGNHGLKKFYEAFKALMSSNKTEQIIISDSAQPAKIADLNSWAERDDLNCVFIPVKKFPGCVKWRLDIINRHKLNLVKRDHIKKEQENYAYRTIQGIKTNEPIDDFNHFWDAAGYACQYVDALRG